MDKHSKTAVNLIASVARGDYDLFEQNFKGKDVVREPDFDSVCKNKWFEANMRIVDLTVPKKNPVSTSNDDIEAINIFLGEKKVETCEGEDA